MTFDRDKIRRVFPLLSLLLALLILTTWYLTRHPPSDKEQIRSAIQAIAQATRERNSRGILTHVAATYRDAFHSTREDLSKMLRFVNLRYRKATVTLSDIQIQLPPSRPDTALVTLTGVVLLGSDPNRPPTNKLISHSRGTDQWRLHFQRNEDGVWLLHRTE